LFAEQGKYDITNCSVFIRIINDLTSNRNNVYNCI